MRKFNPERELYKIQYGNRNKILYSIILLLLIISIGSTYALYQVRYSKRIIYTKVAPFSNKDIILTVLIDGETSNDFPNMEDGYYFNGLDCETKGVTAATWNYKLWTLNLTSSKPNKCNVLFSKEPSLLTERIKFLNEHKEENLESLADDDPDNNIRYIGKNPNNYIWFNCNDYDDLTQETAPQQCEKWQIIGLMNNIIVVDGYEETENKKEENLVKIVRADSIGNITWDSANTSNWATASLQNGLNGPYLNGEESSWITSKEYNNYNSNTISNNYKSITDATKPMIEQVKWNIGGWASTAPGILVNDWYAYEKANNSWDGYIAIENTTDYGYATSGLKGNSTYNREGCLKHSLYYWDDGDYKPNCALNSWVFNGALEWTLAPQGGYVLVREAAGGVWIDGPYKSDGVRPSLYLKSNVKILNGTGSSEKPYILTLQ